MFDGDSVLRVHDFTRGGDGGWSSINGEGESFYYNAKSIKRSDSANAAVCSKGSTAGDGRVQSWAKVPLKPKQPRW